MQILPNAQWMQLLPNCCITGATIAQLMQLLACVDSDNEMDGFHAACEFRLIVKAFWCV